LTRASCIPHAQSRISPDGAQRSGEFSLKNHLAPDLQMECSNPVSSGNPTQTMKTNPIAVLVGASAIAFCFTACDSKQEQAREEKLEAKADAIDAEADQLRKDSEKAAEMKDANTDAIRQDIEKQADQIEDTADDIREKK
jgi:hypothetical protein